MRNVAEPRALPGAPCTLGEERSIRQRTRRARDHRADGSGVLPWLGMILLVAVASSLLVGRCPIRAWDALRVVGRALSLPVASTSRQTETILLFVRFPRVAVAALVGVSLSVSGAAFQGLFRNAIVSPDLLGASSGAGFGASMAILFSLGLLQTQMIAFACGVCAVVLAYAVSTSLGRGTLSLLLSGVAVSALFSALTSMTKLVADPSNKLPAITFWLMGGLANVTVRDVPVLLGSTVAGAAPLYFLRWRLNVLALGDDHAFALGVPVARLQPLVVACATLLTASSVAICGMVGWVGLLVPNIARALVGSRFDRLLPASMCLGATFVVVMDTLSRTLWTAEIPIGILLSLLGAPFLLFMLGRSKAGRR